MRLNLSVQTKSIIPYAAAAESHNFLLKINYDSNHLNLILFSEVQNKINLTISWKMHSRNLNFLLSVVDRLLHKGYFVSRISSHHYSATSLLMSVSRCSFALHV